MTVDPNVMRHDSVSDIKHANWIETPSTSFSITSLSFFFFSRRRHAYANGDAAIILYSEMTTPAMDEEKVHFVRIEVYL